MAIDSTEPAFGRRILVSHVDHLARTCPDRVYASIPKSAVISEGFRDVTWREFGNAISRSAAWLEKTLNGKSSSFETVAYIGAADLRYFVFMLAANKIGYKLLLPSPRNSLKGQLNLIDKTECKTILYSQGIDIRSILTERPQISSGLVPTFDEVLDPTPVPHYHFDRTFEQASTEPFVVFHSSGSTGLPKPIVSPQDAACTVDAINSISPLDGKEVFYTYFAKVCPRFFCSLPFFHAAGVIIGLEQCVYFGNTVVFSHPDRPLSSTLMDEVIDHGKLDGIFTPPSILDEMSKTQSSLDRLSKLNMVFVGAGPLPTPAGRTVSQRTFVAIGAGSTEAYLWVTHAPDPEDWQYFMINEKAAGIDMRPDPATGLSEMVYVRRPECEHLQAIFKTFRHLHEYATGDLFEAHPTKAHLWRSMGRRDDILVLSTGENVQPGPISDSLSGHKAVREAVVVGHGRPRISVILELRSYPESYDEEQQLLDDIWPVIEKANQLLPSHGRLLRQFVILASPEKPFVRVGKGSISKPSTLKLYTPEIEALYEQAESRIALDIAPLDIRDQDLLQTSLQSVFETVTGQSLPSLDADFFTAGADSIAALVMASTVRKACSSMPPGQVDKISPRLVYTHPSTRQLASALVAVAENSKQVSLDESDSNEAMQELINSVLDNVRFDTPPSQITEMTKKSVLLTGSTGYLGSYILDAILSDTRTSHVYCFNRADDAREKQTAVNQARGLSTDFSRVTFVKGDLSMPDFNLDSNTFGNMIKQVSLIIPFRLHVQGVANLALFASRAPSRPLICFTSSISAVRNWTSKHGLSEKVPEETLTDANLASSGYGLSKLASSLVLDHAAKSGVRSLILRLGQICGPEQHGKTGVWSRHEWLPSLVTSSKFLGMLPDSLGGMETIDWIPVDRAARCICELTTAAAADFNANSTASYAHVVSPSTTTWYDTVLPELKRHFGSAVQTVPLAQWVARLEESAEQAPDHGNPAVKLVELYRSLVTRVKLPMLNVERAVGMSPALRGCSPVNEADVRRWLASWGL